MKIILVFLLSEMLPLTALAGEDSQPVDPSIDQSETKILLTVKPGENVDKKMQEAGLMPVPDDSMTQEDIEKSVKDFMDNINFESMITLSEPGRFARNKTTTVEKYTRGSDFVVQLDFIANGAYPIKYSFMEYFKDDPNPEYYHQMSNRIFKDLLGGSYKNFDPILLESSKLAVTIEAIFRNEDELRNLLSLPGIVGSRHLGTPGTSEEVLLIVPQ